MPTPSQAPAVVKTARLARLLPYYRDVLGCRVVQHVPGVVALIELHGVPLQLWQRNDFGGHSFCVVLLEGGQARIRQLHAAFARSDAGALMESRPTLQPWGSWEFGVVDIEGNQIVFEQWITGVAQVR
ncbi:MAG TPA: hypothetical protein VIL30_07165 [Ramlibacter sp.]|jgi:catechol 2,3-dioxygenase-like lactoylglutathione lyase family enzyme